MKYKDAYPMVAAVDHIRRLSTRYFLHRDIGVRTAGSLICVISLAAILLVDYYFANASPNLFFIAALDQIAHVSTAVMLLVVLARWINQWVVIGCILGATLIDIDHIPILLRTSDFSSVVGRPVTHSLISVFVLVVVALIAHGSTRFLMLGVLLGVATHLFRDAGTGGIPLLWPLAGQTIEISYIAYVAPLSAVTVTPLLIHTARRTRALMSQRRVHRTRRFDGSSERRSHLQHRND